MISVFLDMMPCLLVITDISEEHFVSMFRVVEEGSD